ncbi:MAG: glutamate--tRNA ligase, partial [bacterium]|nr:glutamate--tRNA ligase [bacterium]
GIFILRIEDTDKERELEGSLGHIIESLRWLELDWDYGPEKDGPNAPYIQSERLDIYKKYAEILVKKGLAYPDPYTEDEVQKFREQAEAEKKPFLYREHRPEVFGVWDGKRPLRFKTPEIKSYSWNDLVQGKLSAGPEALDDFILIKGDGYPTYNFAHIVDDIEMKVSHVFRGQEFISSTPKFLSVYEAFGVTPPLFVTTPPIMAPSGNKKLSKRDGAKDLLEYRTEGYMPETMINYLTFLGFNPGGEREVYGRQELTEVFDLAKIQHSGAKWSDEKLNWFNKEHIKILSKDDVERNILEWLPKEIRGNQMARKLVPLILDRIVRWGDVKTMAEAGELDLFFKPPVLDKTKLIYKNSSTEKIAGNLKLAIETLQRISEDNFTLENVKTDLMKVADTLESRGELLHPVRMALSGKEKSPDPFTLAAILGKEEALARLKTAINLLS